MPPMYIMMRRTAGLKTGFREGSYPHLDFLSPQIILNWTPGAYPKKGGRAETFLHARLSLQVGPEGHDPTTFGL